MTEKTKRTKNKKQYDGLITEIEDSYLNMWFGGTLADGLDVDIMRARSEGKPDSIRYRVVQDGQKIMDEEVHTVVDGYITFDDWEPDVWYRIMASDGERSPEGEHYLERI